MILAIPTIPTIPTWLYMPLKTGVNAHIFTRDRPQRVGLPLDSLLAPLAIALPRGYAS